ncbi:MAG TPA: ribosome biogenesis factor YjgA [Burkholderiales bacterium]|nr:ribosome biogenesis factor YjgA [Burkholderiales bacterium]
MDAQAPPSKTQRKRESSALQDIGERLARLDPQQLHQLGLPERLLEAVLEVKRIGKFGALRRQLQYIGRLMREADADAIRLRLESLCASSREATAHLHLLERWRTRLLEDDSALTELAGDYPGCDTQRLRQLVRSARREQAQGLPPHSARTLFRALKLAIPDRNRGR